jgi:hypothetical protein
MKFRVLAGATILSVTVSAGHADAQTAPVLQPAGANPDGPSPAQAAFPTLEPAPAVAAPTPPPATAAAPASAPVHSLPPPPLTPDSDGAPAADRPAPPAGQSYFGFGAQLGFYNPNGLVVHVGVPAVAIEASAGFAPLLLSYRSDSQYEDNELKFLVPFEVSTQLVIHAVTFKHDMRGNLLLGYRYNRALGQGITLGGEIESRVTRKLVLQGLWGVSFYPDASDHLRRDRVPSDAEFKFPPWLGYGLSVGLLFYP